MQKKRLTNETVRLMTIVAGGQSLGTLENGKKVFVFGALPEETADVQLTKLKSSYAEGVATCIHEASPHRVEAQDPDSYLSTSPWQIMSFHLEQQTKSRLIGEAFKLHHIDLSAAVEVFTDGTQYGYRNKVEFSWWWTRETDTLDLSFFRRGSHGRIPVTGTSLAMPSINEAAIRLRDILRRRAAEARHLKTAMIRCTQAGKCVVQLYVKESGFAPFSDSEIAQLSVQGFELIFSDPRSPASRITERLQAAGDTTLSDKLLDVSFTYPCESFFQVNLPVYEQALRDMRDWLPAGTPLVDMYSGVGTIGLTIGGQDVTLVEIDDAAVENMRQNVSSLGIRATVVHASSETALDTIASDKTIILDPPRAGLHAHVVARLLQTKPQRIIYLSCNPVTQARDIASLSGTYAIRHIRGYNFFPRTPHIECLAVLDRL